ncbi:YraN family protein [Gleimia hominis]|uniref:YraN family protein n=1 Tax=Gleimia hominis TaxID=595468 RepID=UPI000C7FB76F|nr:YraN family protein [Gleimia hominis]WIK65311.1 YraN family protein [Gleimia hominis]
MKRTRYALGRAGEDAAANYLRDTLGWRILERNYKRKHCELDIVADDGTQLVVVEVRTRRGSSCGTALESVTEAKLNRLHRGAHQWRCERGVNRGYRVDLLTVSVRGSHADLQLHRGIV